MWPYMLYFGHLEAGKRNAMTRIPFDSASHTQTLGSLSATKKSLGEAGVGGQPLGNIIFEIDLNYHENLQYFEKNDAPSTTRFLDVNSCSCEVIPHAAQ
jgi:hypothetical protein